MCAPERGERRQTSLEASPESISAGSVVDELPRVSSRKCPCESGVQRYVNSSCPAALDAASLQRENDALRSQIVDLLYAEHDRESTTSPQTVGFEKAKASDRTLGSAQHLLGFVFNPFTTCSATCSACQNDTPPEAAIFQNPGDVIVV